MGRYLSAINKTKKLTIETLVDDYKSSKDKDNFRPSGTQLYVGRQGQGKTISAVYAVMRLIKRYPKSILVTNLLITGRAPIIFKSREQLMDSIKTIDTETQYIYFQDSDELSIALVAVNNGKYGVIYLIDEIHTYLNATDSKNIPTWVFTEISQQRKQHKLIIGTSQLYKRTGLAIREQLDNLIQCSTHFGIFTIQKCYSGDDIDESKKTLGKSKKTGFFIQTRKIRELYDTYQKVVSGLEVFDDSKPIEISIKTKSKFALK